MIVMEMAVDDLANRQRRNVLYTLNDFPGRRRPHMRAGDYNLGLVDNDGGIRADFRSVHSGNGCVDAIGNLLDFEIGRGDAFWTCLVFGLRFEEACDGPSIHSLARKRPTFRRFVCPSRQPVEREPSTPRKKDRLFTSNSPWRIAYGPKGRTFNLNRSSRL